MTDKKILSIIISAFNMEAYLNRCLDALINQEFDRDSVEILIINDGSTDNTLEVARTYIASHHGISILTQENMGLGAARNAGIKNASGKYLWLIDADDYVNHGSVKTIVDHLKITNPGALVLNWRNVLVDGSTEDQPVIVGKRNVPMSGSEYYLNNHTLNYAWMYIFSRNVVTENNLTFLAREAMEDAEFLPRYLLHINNLIISEIDAYRYAHRSDSITHDSKPSARAAFLDSMAVVYASLRHFQAELQHAEHSQMWSALELYCKKIEWDVFQRFMCGPFSWEMTSQRLENLERAGLFPFASMPKRHPLIRGYHRAVMSLTNVAPIQTKMILMPPLARLAAILQSYFKVVGLVGSGRG